MFRIRQESTKKTSDKREIFKQSLLSKASLNFDDFVSKEENSKQKVRGALEQTLEYNQVFKRH